VESDVPPSGISTAAFDDTLDKVVASIQLAMVRTKPEEYFPTVWMIYADRWALQTLVGEGEVEIYKLLCEFGRSQRPGKGTFEAAFVSAAAADDEGTCIFVSGSTPDGRLNGARLGFDAGDHIVVEPKDVRPLYCREGSIFKGRTFAGEFLRGFLE
jgi:hypothetical protein